MGYVMNRQLAAFTLIFLPLMLFGEGLAANEQDPDAAQRSEGDALPVVKLSPHMREQDRGLTLDCRQLAQGDARSEPEKQWLEERKNACLERYRAFSPRSDQR
ncbi:MAG: hypothetical protein ACI89D_001645 [Bermanella sp.]|jgi:hypothetical protein